MNLTLKQKEAIISAGPQNNYSLLATFLLNKKN